MNENELNEILRLHKMWLNGESGGKKAELNGMDLSGANLAGANLKGADLSNTNLCNANLCEANLYGANLKGANLKGANLSGANLNYANLQNANISNTNCGHNTFFGCVKGVPVYQAVRGFGSSNRALTLLAIGERKAWRWFSGCFEGTEEELRKAVFDKYGDSKTGKGYLLAIDYLVAQAELNDDLYKEVKG